MLITINGKQETLSQTKTLADLISVKNLAPERIVVEHNFRIVAKDDLPKVLLNENDTVEIVSFVGGG